jgi:uncharacterized protein YfcZ (UPF0381/DUF406 family)
VHLTCVLFIAFCSSYYICQNGTLPHFKTISSFILLLLAGVLTCSSHLYLARQRHLQQSVKERMSKKPIHFITISLDKHKTLKAGDEIVVNGCMFDIEGVIQNSDGSFLVKGHFDEEETKLLKQFTNSQQDKESEESASISSFHSFQFTFSSNTQYFFTTSISSSKWALPLNEDRLSHTFKDILTPPPKA